MTDQKPTTPPKRGPSVIIDDQMPKRLIVQLSTHEITPDAYQSAVAAWLASESPPSPAYYAARTILAAIVASR